jgi:hypothetical protein
MALRLAAPILSLCLALGFAGTLPVPTAAQQQASERTQVTELFEALGLPEMIAVMGEEGIGYGETIAADLFGSQPGADWEAMVGAIYDAAVMREAVETAMASALDEADLQPMLDFFQSDTGRNIVALEVAARRALLDDAVEEASKAAAAIARADATARFGQVERFVEINDLIEANVVGALNSNYAFYIGLQEGGAFPQALPEDEILADVWAQEAEIRESTTEWVYSFLMMAYQPLGDAEMEAYIAFSQTGAGQRLNRAMFSAFDEVFNDISLTLGRAASRFMIGQEL